MKKIYLFLALVSLSVSFAFSQTEITVTDDDLQSGQYFWTSNNIYILDGFVFLEEGGELYIEAGTVIKGKETPTNNDLASTLIITRGAKIYAEGNSRNPIVFTAEIDDPADPFDLTGDDRGLWGGLIILGNGAITDETTEEIVEGLPPTDDRALYGGNDDNDDSGVLRYVSIRHGGAELAPGEEINGLTLGAVGSGTVIDHVEVFANSDDGIEWFGGTASIKYASVAFCGDDSYDYDTGWRGRGQFFFSIQSTDAGDNGGEHDGAKPDDGEPTSSPVIYNATYIGSGVGGTAKNEHALYFRDGTAGTYANSIFTDFANFALQVEDRASGVDSRQRMEEGDLTLPNNIWFGFGEGTELNAGTNGILQATDDAEDPTCQFLIDHLVANSNSLEDPILAGISRDIDGGLDPRPATAGPAYDDLAALPNDDWYDEVPFKGAFGGTLWLRGWTALSEYGYLPATNMIVIQDSDLEGNNVYNWTNDNVYMLDGFVYLEEGGILNIGPGTIIKGMETPSNNDLASTLIITRGARINALGTAGEPIIFTAEIDDTDDPFDLTVEDRGLWGGLIILGNGVIADETTEEIVEGLPPTDDRALYGGNNDNDNSGILNYISIRHGGAELAPGEEINGLTLGAVGSGTQISHVEVLANSDDGIEWFGGTVSVKYAAVGFCGDDSYDYDTGWRGNGQFWLALQSSEAGDNAGEHDGAKPDDGEPTSNPTIYNVTYIGSGVGSQAKNEHGLYFRDGTGATYANSIITDFANFAIQVEDRASGIDSRQRMEDGDLNILNNIWFGFGEGNELNAGANGIIQATDDAEDPSAQFLINHLAANGNTLEDPELGGISRIEDGGFDPRPAESGPAYNSTLANLPNDDFFTEVDYKGAFCTDGVWLKGWTAVSEYGVLNGTIPYADACITTSVNEVVLEKEKEGYILVQNSPNPFSNVSNINFVLPKTTNVTISIFDAFGQLVAQPVLNEMRASGQHTIEVNAGDFSNGMYYYTLQTADVTLTKSMVISK